MKYTIHRGSPALDLNWDAPIWREAETLTIGNFLARSSDHRPLVQARVLHDDQSLYVFFRVEDRYVRSVATNYLDPVCRDSCVEFFVEPVAGKGYFNIEFNCGGTLLLFYIEDPTRNPGGPTEFKKMTKVEKEIAEQIKVAHSMPNVVEPEIAEPTTWLLQYSVPISVFETYVGHLGTLPGRTWRGNFYKCADKSSHPHWASWAPLDAVNFHLPKCFAPITFAP
jgi:hypothetical protein